MPAMKQCLALALALSVSWATAAQEATIGDLLDSAAQWAEENLDETLLSDLQEAQRGPAKDLLTELQKRFQASYVLDLAGLKEGAQRLLPVLESYEETYSYALWLSNRLDFLGAAEDLKRQANRETRTTETRPPNPTVAQERAVWKERLEQRPWPGKATGLVPRLKPIFEAERVPSELVWIAEVESSFDARAKSPMGAAGLFQLMPRTAKRFGLQTWPTDERLQPEASARASARYLKFLHDKFKDWRLAVAAYNAGEGTIDKAIERQGSRKFEMIAPILPAETQLYVPRVEATLAKREGADLGRLPTPAA